jgi:hypothetical protein
VECHAFFCNSSLKFCRRPELTLERPTKGIRNSGLCMDYSTVETEGYIFTVDSREEMKCYKFM